MNWPEPKDVLDIISFMDITRYYEEFIEGAKLRGLKPKGIFY